MHLCWLGNVLIDSLVKTFKMILLSEHLTRIQEVMGVCVKSQKSNCKLLSLAFGQWVLKYTKTSQSKLVEMITPWYLKSYCNISNNIFVIVGIIHTVWICHCTILRVHLISMIPHPDERAQSTAQIAKG